jgi:hypothetical protein
MSAEANVIAIIQPSDPAEALRSERASLIADLEAVARKLAKLAEARKTKSAFSPELPSSAKKKSRLSRPGLRAGVKERSHSPTLASERGSQSGWRRP